MLAWVTSGLVAPGVHAGSGSTPAPTARAWHSAPPNGGTDATGALVRAEPLALGEADGEVTSGELAEGGEDEAEADGRDDDGEVVNGAAGGADAGIRAAQAASGSSQSSPTARLTGSSRRAGRHRPKQARAAARVLAGVQPRRRTSPRPRTRAGRRPTPCRSRRPSRAASAGRGRAPRRPARRAGPAVGPAAGAAPAGRARAGRAGASGRTASAPAPGTGARRSRPRRPPTGRGPPP